MKRGGRRQVHLINLSGHSQTGYFDPVPMRDIEIQVKGAPAAVRAIHAGRELSLARSGGYTKFTVPWLGDYELVELQ